EEGAVLACSALKQSYRDTLSSGLKINWVHLSGGFELIHNRMQLRSHFMPASLLQSQFDTLEPLKEGLTLDITAAPEYLIYQIRQRFEVQQAAQWGIVGMGVMGKSLAINALNKGIATAVYNRDTPEEAHIIPDLIQSQDNPNSVGIPITKTLQRN
ncbi:NAD(P)-binding domain-containing protein, partial [Gilvibacter sp.]|uniref:NAD(P)-binding domain-containing protein n=1 Tax=Gilvibacter sp. TaxID=2729997 RepID=UPI003F49D778